MIILKHLLHPTDFSQGSEAALKYACSMAIQFNATLHLIHVIEEVAIFAPVMPFEVPPDFEERRLRFANESLTDLPYKVINHTGDVVRNLCTGAPVAEILRYARQNAIDMIVMGTHGHTGLEHVLIGSVAERVVRGAPCPVLTVRAVNKGSTTLY